MIIKRNTLIAAGGVSLLVVVIALFFALRPSAEAQSEKAAPASQAVAEKTEKTQSAEAPTAKVIPIQFQQNGLYKIAMQNFETTTLADRFDFIAHGLKATPDPYTGEYTMPAEYPPNIQLTHILIPAKNLDIIALQSIYAGGWCDQAYCVFQFFIKRGDKYELYMNLMSTKNNYLLVEDKSISLILCEGNLGYTQWRLEDGALDKPMPINAPGYFIPQPTPYKHEGMETCP